MKKSRYPILKIWIILSAVIVVSIILFIILFIFAKGISFIDMQFVFDRPRGMPLGVEGGIFPAIVGSLYFTLIAAFFASIIALSVAVYIKFYAINSKITALMHLVIQSITGIPSIVLGLFGYSFLVVYLNMGVSLLAGGLTLGVMIFPFIEVRVEKILNEVDKEIIYSSYALGLSKSYTFFKLVLPICFNDILSTITLAAGFAMGAAAPVIFTGAVINSSVPKSILSPAMALPYHLYILVGEGISLDMAYATASVLLIILFLINLLVLLAAYLRKVG
ncbi:MAG: PstA family ABC transporter permease [Bacillota bacterium]